MRTIVLKSLDDIWVMLLRDANRMRDGLVYRGEPRTYPSVLPAIARFLPKDYDRRDLFYRESVILRRFRKLVLPHLSAVEVDLLNHEPFEGIAVMRHYGAPTRFVDWTESPAVALYFACADRSAWQEQGRVLWLDAQLVNAHAKRVLDDKFYRAHRKMVNTEKVKRLPRFMSAEHMEGSPEFVQCEYFTDSQPRRMVAQQGLVTFSSHPWLDHWAVAGTVDSDARLEMIIEPALKKLALRMLDEMNVNHATLFPDAFGAAAYVEQEFLLFLDEVRKSGEARTAPIGAPTGLKGKSIGGPNETANPDPS